EEAEDDPLTVLVADGEPDAGRERKVPAHDRVAAQEVDLPVEHVHRAALALGHAVLAPEELGHDAPGVPALGEDVAVLAVAGDRVVVGAQRRHRPHPHALLPDVEVQEAADLAEGVHLGRLLLEPPDQLHLLEEGRADRGVPARKRRRPRFRRCHCPASLSSGAHQRINARSSTLMRIRARKIATMMASPTATSAAATVITKNTMIWPCAPPCARPKATNARFAAFSISSIDMKMTSGLRRTRTPTTPIVNRIADSPT